MSSFSRGDIVLVDLNPTQGHEQGNKRPALVINSYPLPGGVSIVLPITTKNKSFPLEVPLDKRTTTQGTILCFQIRTLDLSKRGAKILEKAPKDIVDTCAEYITRLTN